MAEPQLTVRSAKARDLAHRLARRERCSITQVVERALEAYEARREPPAAFYERLAADCASDLDLEAGIRDARQPGRGLDL